MPIPANDQTAAGTAPAAPAVSPAIQAPATPTPAALDQPKWSPYLSVGGAVGSQSGDTVGGVHVTAFAPIWQDLNSLLFVRFGAGTETHANLISNFGLGYRTKLNDEWILGAYAGFDSTQTTFDNTFWQGSFGAEAMSADWDVRVNGYIATQMRPRDLNSFSLFIQDTRIAVLQGQDAAYSGFDGEVGYRVFSADNLDLRVFAGGFDFSRSDNSFVAGGKKFNLAPDIIGPMGRAELDLYNLDLFGQQSRLIVTGEVTHDDVRGTSGYAGVSLHIPLGGNDSGSDDDEIDRRMVDQVRRNDDVLTRGGFTKPEPVIIYDAHITSKPTNTLYYVDNTAGAGTYADPTTLKDATGRGPNNQFVVLTDKDGSTVNASGVNVASGETITGPGTFTVRGEFSGKTFTHDFAPGSGPVSLSTADGINVTGFANLYGFTIDSTAPNAIYGHNVSDLTISGVTVIGSGAAGNGIYVHNDSGASGSVKIENTTVTGVLTDGIKLVVDNATGSTANTSFKLTNVSATGGVDGLYVGADISNASHESLYLGVHDSTLTGGSVALDMASTVSGGGALNSLTIIDPTHLAGGTYGLRIVDTSNGGVIGHTISVSDVDITGATYSGITIAGYANTGTVDQGISLTNVTANGSEFPLQLLAYADNGTILQTASLNHVSVANGYANMTFVDYAEHGGTALQYIAGSYLTASGALHGDGLYAYAGAYDHSTATQRIAFEQLDASGSSLYGAGFYAHASDDATPGSYVTQTIALDHATFADSGAGLSFVDRAEHGGTALQDFAGSYINASGALHGDGVFAYIEAYDHSIAQQRLSFDHIDASGASAYAGQFYEHARNNASAATSVASQYISFDHAMLDNSADGLRLGETGYYQGHVFQNLYVSNSSISHTTDGTGLYMNAFANKGRVEQFARVGNSHIDGSGYDGVNISLGSYGGGAAYGSIDFYGTTVNNSGAAGLGGAGIVIGANAVQGGTTHQSIYLGDSLSVTGNQGNAITLEGVAFSHSYTYQYARIHGADASHNNGTGVYEDAESTFYSTINQTVVADHVNASYEAGYGVRLIARGASSGTVGSNVADQYGSFEYFQIDHNGGGVMAGVYTTGQAGSVNQQLTVTHSSITANTATSVYAETRTGVDSTSTQYLNFANDTITNSARDGVKLHAVSYQGSTASQTGVFNNDDFSGAARDGIDIYGAVIENATLNQDFTFNAVQVDNAANDGLYAIASATFGGTLTQTIGGTGFHASGAGGYGIELQASATGNGFVTPTSVAQYVSFNNATIDNSASDGVYAYLAVTAPGASGRQDVTVSNGSISNSGGYGVYAFADAASYSSATQNVNLVNDAITGSANTGVYIGAYAASHGTIHQTGYLAGDTITNSGGDGVHLYGYAGAYSSVNQAFGLYHVDVSHAAGNGVFAYAGAHAGSTTQNIVSTYLTANYEGDYGVDLLARANGVATTFPNDDSVVGQYASFNRATIGHNPLDGIYASVGSFDRDAAARQDLTVLNSNISNNGGAGVYAVANAAFYSSTEQNVALLGDTISNNTADGVYLGAASFALGSVHQTGYLAYDQINHNGGDGIHVYAGTQIAGQVLQDVGVYVTYAKQNGRDGFEIVSNAYGYGIGSYAAYYSHIGQNITSEFSSFDLNGRNGVEIHNYAGYGAQLNQFAYFYGVEMNDNGTGGAATTDTGNGFYQYSHAQAFGGGGFPITTNLYSNVYLIGSRAGNNAGDGMRINGVADGPTYMISHIQIANSASYDNGRSGLVVNNTANNYYSLNIQYVTLSGSQFDANKTDGAQFVAYQNYGPGNFGAAIQDVTIVNSEFSANVGNGLFASATAVGQQGRAEQHFTIQGSYFNNNGIDGASFTAYAHDGILNPGYTCDVVQGLPGGCAFVRETIQVVGSHFDNNTNDGIYVGVNAANYGAVYSNSGRPANTPTLVMQYSTADGNGGNGLNMHTTASANSYAYSYAVLLGSNFDHNGLNGVNVDTSVSGGGAIGQKVILYGLPGGDTTASYNTGDGLHVAATSTGGTIQQLVGAYYSVLNHNTGSGIVVTANADSTAAPGTAVVGQYIGAVYTQAQYNGSYGLDVTARANGALAATQQNATISYSSFSNNGNDGIHAFEIAYAQSAANQYIDLKSDTIDHNSGNGFYAVSLAVGQSSTQQTVNFDYHAVDVTSVSYNNNDGVYVGTAAFSGGTAQQNVFLYGLNASHNGQDGVGIGAGANGYGFGAAYIYYSHVSQNVIAAYDTVAHNGGNGISISDTAYYGGAMNQFIGLYGMDLSYNTRAGLYDTAHLTSVRGNSFAFSTNMTNMLYVNNSTIDHNGGNGIDQRSYNNGAVYDPAFFGGYSYLIQHNRVSGSDVSYNGGDGMFVSQNERGRYGLNAQYFTVAGSTFNGNNGDGAHFESIAYYGPGGFGDTYQNVQISGSTFNGNQANGLSLYAEASGRQGRAEQHVTIAGSAFDDNHSDGVFIYASAKDGTYVSGLPCTVVQGLPGGCAFVRQSVNITGSDISHNSNDGIDVVTYANNYGAIYGASGRPHSPTLEIYGSTVNANGNRGLDVSNHATGNSYLYQYVAAIDSTFDNNHSDGIYMSTYGGGGSTVLQRGLLYSYHLHAGAANNGGNGMKTVTEALGGSYIRDVTIAEGAYLNHNGSFGFDGAVAYADGTSTGLQINALYSNALDHNGDGVGFYSIGSGAQQISYVGGNYIVGNAFVGVYGEANFGAFQYIDVYSLGNNTHDNGTDYLFNAFGGSTQILN
jgi:hypothetical protein